MAITLGSNIASLMAQRQLGKAGTGLSKTYERLSSGLRINRASDDAAGLAVASSLNASTKVLGQAIRNVNDGISLGNIAEGALEELKSISLRQRELATQAANGTYTITQRQAMNSEVNALVEEYNRIVQSTQFNGRNLFENGSQQFDIQADSGRSSSIGFVVGDDLARNVGDGTFQANVTFATGSSPMSVATGDLNGDGSLDFITADAGSNRASVFIGNGDGTFKANASFAVGLSPYSVTTGDFNGDGKLDLVTADPGTNQASVLIGNGDGTFKAKAAFATSSSPMSVATGDLNGDGSLDFITADAGSNRASVFIGNGDGTFKANATFVTGSNPTFVTTGDFNGDGRLDLITADYASNRASVFIGNGDGTFKAKTTFVTGSLPHSLTTGDFFCGY